jgi:coatomer protein complex subunit gamma
MVSYEAAKAICLLSDITTRELSPAISVLQLMLDSSRVIHRFAAIHTLSRVAMRYPTMVASCNTNIESLVTDPNRSIATLAITTLLKTGNESSVDRLIKQIAIFMAEISDEFKIVIIEAVKTLCLKFPSKYVVMLTFLASSLREEGGYEFKRSIVDAIFAILKDIPESKESGKLSRYRILW